MTTYSGGLYLLQILLNQACAGHRLAHSWFLETDLSLTFVCVYVCMFPPLRLLITSGMMWHDMDFI